MNMLFNIVYPKEPPTYTEYLLTLLHNLPKIWWLPFFLVKGRGFPQKSFNCVWVLGGNNSANESGFPAARTFGLVCFFVCLFDLGAQECCLPLGRFTSPYICAPSNRIPWKNAKSYPYSIITDGDRHHRG